MKKTYELVDIIKLFFSICVVAIHSKIFQDNSRYIGYVINHGIFRLAVPFFFVCSGYFLGNKLNKFENTDDKITEIKKYIKRLIIPFIFWLIIGMIRQIYDLRHDDVLIIINTIVKKIFFYPWGALWYILAVIIATIILIPFIKKQKIKYAVFLGSALYIFALFCNNYYFLVENTVIDKIVTIYMNKFISARNGVFVGFLFVTLGFYLSEFIKNKDIKLKELIIIFIISYIILFLEMSFLYGKTTLDDNALFISFIVLIPSLLTILLKVSYSLNVKIDTKILRNYSTGIYFMHRPILDFIYLMKINLNSYESFLIVIFVCVIILTILYKINNKYINSVIK